MKSSVVTRAEARAAVLQLRSLLLADVAIIRAEAQRLADLAVHLISDDMHPIEVTVIPRLPDRDQID